MWNFLENFNFVTQILWEPCVWQDMFKKVWLCKVSTLHITANQRWTWLSLNILYFSETNTEDYTEDYTETEGEYTTGGYTETEGDYTTEVDETATTTYTEEDDSSYSEDEGDSEINDLLDEALESETESEPSMPQPVPRRPKASPTRQPRVTLLLLVLICIIVIFETRNDIATHLVVQDGWFFLSGQEVLRTQNWGEMYMIIYHGRVLYYIVV